MKLTGIGSTPFKNFDNAIEFSKIHDLAFFPEPKSYFLNPSLEPIAYFLKQTKNLPEIKIQLIGPVTFTNQTKKDFSEYQKKFYPLIEILKKEKKKIYLQLDEPILPSTTCEKNWLKESLNQIKNEQLIPLIHSCAKIPDNHFFSFLDSGNLAIDLDINPKFSTHQRLLVSGIDPENNNERITSEFFSFTCGYGLMSEKKCLNIFERLQKFKFLYR